MAKLYLNKPSKEEDLGNLQPRKETISFLLNYSKALRVIDYNKIKFEAFLN